MSATSAVPSVPGFLDRFLLAPVIWELYGTLLAQVRTAVGATIDLRKQACDFLGKAASAVLSVLFWLCVVLSLGVAYLVASRRRDSLKEDSNSWYSWVLAVTGQQPEKKPDDIPPPADPTPMNPKRKGVVPIVSAFPEQVNGEEQMKWLVNYFFEPYDSPVQLDFFEEAQDPYDAVFYYAERVQVGELEALKFNNGSHEDMHHNSSDGDGPGYSSVLDRFRYVIKDGALYFKPRKGIRLKEESNRVKWNALIAKLLQLK
jgi:hypothetical protein